MTSGANTISVVICCYSDERFHDVLDAIDSVHDQTRPADEVAVVVDHNPALLARVRSPSVRTFCASRTRCDADSPAPATAGWPPPAVRSSHSSTTMPWQSAAGSSTSKGRTQRGASRVSAAASSPRGATAAPRRSPKSSTGSWAARTGVFPPRHAGAQPHWCEHVISAASARDGRRLRAGDGQEREHASRWPRGHRALYPHSTGEPDSRPPLRAESSRRAQGAGRALELAVLQDALFRRGSQQGSARRSLRIGGEPLVGAEIRCSNASARGRARADEHRGR